MGCFQRRKSGCRGKPGQRLKIRELHRVIGLLMRLPAGALAVVVPAVYGVDAVSLPSVKGPAGAHFSEGERGPADTFGNIDIIACNKCMIVADYGIGGQNYSRVIVIAIADINSAAVAIQQAVRNLVAGDLEDSPVLYRQIALPHIQSGVVVILNIKLAGTVHCEWIVVVEPYSGITIAGIPGVSGHSNNGTVLDGKGVVYGNPHTVVIFCVDGGVIDTQFTGRKAVGTVVVKIDFRILDNKVRAIGAISKAVDNIHLRIGNRGIECTREAGAVVVGDEGRISDIDVIPAITAVPLQSVVRVVFNRQDRAVCQIQLIVATEVNRMGGTGATGCIHGHIDVVQRENGIFAGADRHPGPFSIRCGTNPVHDNVDALKGQCLAPQGNAVLFKGYGRLFRQIRGRRNGKTLG